MPYVPPPPPVPVIQRPAHDTAPTLAQPIFTANGAVIAGNAAPGTIVEVINLSRAPANFERLEDAIEIARTDASGAFHGEVTQVEERDQMRLRVRAVQGTISAWVAFRVQGTGRSDLRAAFVNVDRLRLELDPTDRVAIKHHTALPFTEPGAEVRFRNTRTGVSIDATASATGSLPNNLMLDARAGDSITVAVSDGAGNVNLQNIAATLTVPPLASMAPDPAALQRDRGLSSGSLNAPLFVNDASPHDVAQGAIGNCYVPAALAAIARARPSAILEAIREKGPDLYEVRFYRVDSFGIIGAPTWVEVSGDLYYRSGSLAYGKVPQGRALEAWFPLIEKAYAVFRGGSYDQIEKGSAAQLFAELLGTPNRPLFMNAGATADQLWTKLVAGLEARRSLAFGTYPKDEAGTLYDGTLLHASHAYAVLDVEEDANGVRWVIILNPWANGGNTGANNGVYRLTVSEMLSLAEVLNDA